MPLVYVIVLNYNGKADTLECLRSLAGVSYPDFRILVVDNASADSSVEAIKQDFPRLDVLQNNENLGFAGGNNVGIRYALEQGADYVFLLNNDTVVDPGVLTELVKVGESDQAVGIIGSLIYYLHRPQEVWFASGKIYWPAGTTRHLTTIPDGLREVDFITGCALMIKKQALEKVGSLDPDFFLYYEDTDWSVRVKKAGFKLVVAPASVVWHKEMGAQGGRSPGHEYYVTRNNLLFMKRHANPLLWLTFIPAFTLKIAVKVLLFTCRGQFNLLPPLFKGIKDYLTGRYGKQS